MKYRMATIHARKTYTTDTTEIIDIDVSDPISALIIELAVANITGNTAPTAHALACLTNIELVDGSEVLYGLNAYEADAIDYFNNGELRSNWDMYLAGNDTQRFIGLNFGRFLWDPLLALDPKRFQNLQLKLTLDIDAGGVGATSNKLQVWAMLFDGKQISPVGFLRHYKVKNYAMAASAHEYTDLPTDLAIRKMIVRCQTAGTEPNQLISNIKLSEDQDKKIPVDHGFQDIERAMISRYPKIKEHVYQWCGTSATNGFCTPTTRVGGVFQRWAATVGAGEIAFYDGDGGRFKIIAGTAVSNVNGIVEGWAPHGCVEIPFGDQEDIEDWYNLEGVKSLKADITAASGASSSNTTQVILQQLKKY